MDVYYKVSVTYPNGRTEEIDDTFKTARDAVEFGETILAQIPFNSTFHDQAEEAFDPYFSVKRVDGKDRKLVYDSRVS